MKCLKHEMDVTGCSRLKGGELVKGVCDTCLISGKNFAKVRIAKTVCQLPTKGNTLSERKGDFE